MARFDIFKQNIDSNKNNSLSDRNDELQRKLYEIINHFWDFDKMELIFEIDPISDSETRLGKEIIKIDKISSKILE